MTSRALTLGLSALLLLAACPKKPEAGPTKKKPSGKIGSSCTAEEPGQGTCLEGFSCAPLPGGYCTSTCPCPMGGECVETGDLGEMCQKPCASDSDCRGAKGYICDPGWHTCTQPNLLAPKPLVCERRPNTLERKAFGSVDAISTDTATFAQEPSMTLTKSGDALIAYGIGDGDGVAVVGFSDKSGVGTPRPIAGGGARRASPWLTTFNNRHYLTYLAYDGDLGYETSMKVMVASSSDGETWSQPAVASGGAECTSPGCLRRPVIAVGPLAKDPEQTAIYTLFSSKESSTLLVTTSVDGGASFSAPATVAMDGFIGDLAVTSSGKLHTVYVASTAGASVSPYGDMNTVLEYSNSKDGQTFSAPVRISGEGERIPIYFSSPRIGIDFDAGIIYVTYAATGSDGTWNVVLAASEDGGQSWSRTIVHDDEKCSSHVTPSLVVDAGGKVHLTWVDNRSGQGQLVYTVCTSKGAKCAKNEAVSDVPFASYSLLRHASRALGDYNFLAFDPKKKLLRAVWSQPVDVGGKTLAQVFHSSAKVK